jgi:hypothetical protein
MTMDLEGLDHSSSLDRSTVDLIHPSGKGMSVQKLKSLIPGLSARSFHQ